MPKINQEEYEVLKEIRRNGFEEIRRNSTGDIAVRGTGEKVTSHQYQTKHNDKFKFMEATGDYWSIAELIEEYEDYQYTADYWEEATIKLNEVIRNAMQSSKESEETEVKNIEWLKEETEKRIKTIESDDISFVGSEYYDEGYIDGMRDVLYRINQLDEPKVLSQEWIDERIHYSTDQDAFGNIVRIEMVPAKYLQNLLVPKQERITLKQVINRLYELEQNNQSLWINRILHEFGRVFGINKYQEGYEQGRADGIAELHSDEAVTINHTPTIPQFVANVIEKNKGDGFKLIDTWEILNQRGFVEDIQTLEWVRETADNNELFARAWLAYPDIEVEQEPKYWVRDNNYLLCKWEDEVMEYAEALGRNITDLVELKLTEKEIKDYDSRYWAFKELVEEVGENV